MAKQEGYGVHSFRSFEETRMWCASDQQSWGSVPALRQSETAHVHGMEAVRWYEVLENCAFRQEEVPALRTEERDPH